jgi:hypothetical protein
MNIKSLLLGSAAALAVVSGAQAADAVVAAEPEPMEYVKVCDAYGTGYFYIPGTETCLKIGGQVRYEKRFEKVGSQSASYDNHSRARLNIEAKNDSEWGTVYSWIRIQGDQVNNGGSTVNGVDFDNGTSKKKAQDLKWYYYFGIGGLEFGNWDSQWTKFFGYGGFTDDGGVYSSDWDYTDSRQYISYTAEFGSAKVYVAAQNDADEFYSPEDHSGADLEDLHKGRKYMPDLEAGVSATFGDWEVAGGVAYDESAESFAVKKLVAGKFGMFGVRVMGLYSNSSQNIFFNYDGFSAIVGVEAKVTDTVTLAKDIQWWDNGDWRAVGNVNWEVASGFSVLLEGVYSDRYDEKVKSGMLRFQRKF